MTKTNKLWLRATAVLTLALCLFLGVRAFEKEVELKSTLDPIPVTVYFTESSDNPTLLQDEDNWSDTPHGNCGIGSYLCEVTYDENRYPTLRDFLDANTTQAMIQANSLSFSFKK
ncbi:hypothetical protein [Sphingobacterium faecale]|uniref:Uncharacterized protein n=1 Tax=Sphingobacterium faecale TaxID=2803775 RepID=A0ABS1QYG6_9SPHI|nr:hypothetical protein [Sphingobacterium faecale]MBL1407220.1 hypothetical protein [Sphingobacterium faecale]